MVTPLEALNKFISKDEYDDLGKYHEPDPNHMTPGYGAPNKKSTYPKQTGNFNHNYLSFETQPHSVTFNYKGGVQAVHQNHYTKADHLGQQDYHVNQATKATDPVIASGHKAAAAAHGYQARNMVQPGHDTLTFSRPESHHGGKYDDGEHLPWVGKADVDTYRKKLLKDPDIVPPKGQSKEEVVDGMIKQKIRQRKNNRRANNLLNAEIADPGGGSKAGGDSAMFRLTEFVQKPIEAADDNIPPIWGEPEASHIKKANRLIEVIKIDPEEVKIDEPPKHNSEVHKAELKLIKSYSEKLKDDDFIDEVNTQDEDLEEPFYRYLRDNDLQIDKDLMRQINRDTSTLVHKFKIFYNRPRPHQVDDDIPEIENIAGKSPSYPSGHSTNAHMMGEYLANKFPEHADEFRNIGQRIGLNRIIVGLHYPTDHIAGVELARQVLKTIPGMNDIKKSDAFMDELFKYMAHREELFKDMTQIGTQDILDGVRIDKESNPRIPRKKGQPAKSDKHSDLYTDEDPKGTIQGLGFKDDATAKASVKKIKNSGRAHAHKIQAAVAMEQRAKAAGKSSEAGIYRKYIDSMKKKTQEMEKHTEEEHTQEHNASDNYYPKVSVDKSKKSLLDQIDQIQSKITTGDYDIKKSNDIFLLKEDFKFPTQEEFQEQIKTKGQYTKFKKNLLDALKTAHDNNPGTVDQENIDFLEDYLTGDDELEWTTDTEEITEDGKKKKVTNVDYDDIYDSLSTVIEGDEKVGIPSLSDAFSKLNIQDTDVNKKKPINENNQGNNKDDDKEEEEEIITENTPPDTPPPTQPRGKHIERIDAVKKAYNKLQKISDAHKKIKLPHEKAANLGKYQEAKTEYDNAIRAEKSYRDRNNRDNFLKRDNPEMVTKSNVNKLKPPALTNSEKDNVEHRQQILDHAEEYGLFRFYHDAFHTNPLKGKKQDFKVTKRKLNNMSLRDLQTAMNQADKIRIEQEDEKPPETTEESGPDNTELREQERKVYDSQSELIENYFDRDESGNFKLKENLSKHDVFTGMREHIKLFEDGWKGENNQFNRQKDGSIIEDTGKMVNQRKKVLQNKTFGRFTAMMDTFTSGLQKDHGMTPAQAQKVLDTITREYDEYGEDFMNPDTDKGKKYLEEVAGEENYKNSMKEGDEHAKAAESRFTDGLHDSELFSDDDAKNMQENIDHDDEGLTATHEQAGLSESEQEQERIRQGLPPKGATPPTYTDEDGNDVQAKWNPETHRWVRPSTLISGSAGGTGHFDTMQNDSFMHFTSDEFDELMGFKTGIDSTLGTDILAHKDKDGNMSLHSNHGMQDVYGNNTINQTGFGIKDVNHAKRGASVGSVIDEIKNDRQANPPAIGAKNVYESGIALRTAIGTRIPGAKVKRGRAKGFIGKRGSVEVKERSTPTKTPVIPKIPLISESAALKRVTDKVSNAIRNADANALIRRAKKQTTKLGRKPRLDFNNPITRARLGKFKGAQKKAIKEVMDISGWD